MTYIQAKQIIQHWRRQMDMECDNTSAAIRTIVQLTARAEAAEAALAAVPVDELRRWYGHSDVGCAVSALRYEFDQAGSDKEIIDYWLNGNEDDGVPPAAAYVGPEVQP